MDPSLTKNNKKKTEQNGTRMERLEKKDQERNNLAEGPCSRTEQNDF